MSRIIAITAAHCDARNALNVTSRSNCRTWIFLINGCVVAKKRVTDDSAIKEKAGKEEEKTRRARQKNNLSLSRDNIKVWHSIRANRCLCYYETRLNCCRDEIMLSHYSARSMNRRHDTVSFALDGPAARRGREGMQEILFEILARIQKHHFYSLLLTRRPIYISCATFT